MDLSTEAAEKEPQSIMFPTMRLIVWVVLFESYLLRQTGRIDCKELNFNLSDQSTFPQAFSVH